MVRTLRVTAISSHTTPHHIIAAFTTAAVSLLPPLRQWDLKTLYRPVVREANVLELSTGLISPADEGVTGDEVDFTTVMNLFRRLVDAGFAIQEMVGREEEDQQHEELVPQTIFEDYGLLWRCKSGVYRATLLNTVILQCDDGLFAITDGFEYGRLISTDMERGINILMNEEYELECEGNVREAREKYDREAEGVEMN
ncbi:hypothetical protein K440DRAFT_640022 [Wilcoxina mikolae CBS 423.85]|nr:hypothetical protein K440DRAFT_640022 [Wilcoxina mikolae CBS 423.85]